MGPLSRDRAHAPLPFTGLRGGGLGAVDSLLSLEGGSLRSSRHWRGWVGEDLEVPPVADCGGLTAERHPSSIRFVALDGRWTCGEFLLTVAEKD